MENIKEYIKKLLKENTVEEVLIKFPGEKPKKVLMEVKSNMFTFTSETGREKTGYIYKNPTVQELKLIGRKIRGYIYKTGDFYAWTGEVAHFFALQALDKQLNSKGAIVRDYEKQNCVEGVSVNNLETDDINDFRFSAKGALRSKIYRQEVYKMLEKVIKRNPDIEFNIYTK